MTNGKVSNDTTPIDTLKKNFPELVTDNLAASKIESTNSMGEETIVVDVYDILVMPTLFSA